MYSLAESEFLNSVAGPPHPMGFGTQTFALIVVLRPEPVVEVKNSSIPSDFFDGSAILFTFSFKPRADSTTFLLLGVFVG